LNPRSLDNKPNVLFLRPQRHTHIYKVHVIVQ